MPVPSVSGVPADFFDAGVKKKFYPKGEEPMYESSDEEDAPPILEITPTMDATPTKVGDRVSSNLTSGTYVYTLCIKMFEERCSRRDVQG